MSVPEIPGVRVPPERARPLQQRVEGLLRAGERAAWDAEQQARLAAGGRPEPWTPPATLQPGYQWVSFSSVAWLLLRSWPGTLSPRVWWLIAAAVPVNASQIKEKQQKSNPEARCASWGPSQCRWCGRILSGS